MLRSLRSSFSTSYQLLPSSSSSSPPGSTHNDSSSSLPLPSSSHSAAVSRKRTKRVVLGALAVGASVALLAGWSIGGGGSELGETTLSVGGGPGGDESIPTGLGLSETGALDGEGSTPPGSSSGDISEGGVEGGDEEDDELTNSPPSLSNQTYFSDHPQIQLASPSPLPSSLPLPYPAPSSTCLLHLFTLSSLSSFDPSLCPPSSSPEPLDVVTTFVNGTGPLFLSAYNTALSSVEIKPARRHYSNLGEMRFSLRSAARGLVGDRASRGTIRGVGADFPVEGGEEDQRLYVSHRSLGKRTKI